MKASLTDKQGDEICANVGEMLVAELEAASVKSKVNNLVADYVKKNKISADPEGLSKKLQWSVKVSLKE